MKTYPIVPVPKPRMTRSDRWKKRPCVLRYWAFQDAVRELGITLTPHDRVIFYVPMPQSWPKYKKAAMNGQPHTQNTFDVDNAWKALTDAIFDDDGHLWKMNAEKRWSETGHIVIEEMGAPSMNTTDRGRG